MRVAPQTVPAQVLDELVEHARIRQHPAMAEAARRHEPRPGDGAGEALGAGDGRGAVVPVVDQQGRLREPRAEPGRLELLHRHAFASLDPFLHARRQRFAGAQHAGEPAQELARRRRSRDQRQPLRGQAARHRMGRGQGTERMRGDAVPRSHPRAHGEQGAHPLRQGAAVAVAAAVRRQVDEHRIESGLGQAVAERAPLLRIAGPAVNQQDAGPAGSRVRALPSGQLAAFERMAGRRPGRRHRLRTRLLLAGKRGEEQLQRETGGEGRRPAMCQPQRRADQARRGRRVEGRRGIGGSRRAHDRRSRSRSVATSSKSML